MDNSLDNILNDEPETETVAVEAPAEPETPLETIERPRDENGRFAPKEATGEVETPEEVPPTSQEPVTAPIAALQDERRKRQEAEARAAQLEAYFQQQQAQQPQQQAPDFWEDPEANLNQQFQKFGEQLMQTWEQRQASERMNQSELIARSKYTDFDEKVSAFQQAAQLNPTLAREMAMSPDPGEFAYTRGKTAIEVQQYGSLDALIAAERAKWEAEVKGHFPSPIAPTTLATERNVGARSGPAWSGPKSLNDILG
jgi:hypothetical protein